MNVIVSNKYSAMLSGLNNNPNIDLIKTVNGEFDVDSLIAQFQNFFFNKMILDITAIKGYQDISQIQRLSFGMDMGKIILLLDDSEVVNSPQYLSELVSMGIYNFTRNIEAIPYLVENPNKYKDVAQFHLLGQSGASDSSTGGGTFLGRGTSNSQDFIEPIPSTPNMSPTRVIGFINLTEHAGATSLIYMLKKQLSLYYRVRCYEIDKNDFIYFNDPDLNSVSSTEFAAIIKNPMNVHVVLVDLNNSSLENECSEVVYLIEPTTLMLNRMIRKDRSILDKIKNRVVVLNQSLLNQNDVKDFESEAGCIVFSNIPPLDDKKERHRSIDEFLNKLGFDKNRPTGEGNKGAKLFGIVKE